jgi:fibronectin-binding autotransporter adhesin
MANEFKHKDPGAELTQAEYIAACGDGHIFASQAIGDIVYASSATVLSKLCKGGAGTVLNMGCSCIPAWNASPSFTALTLSGALDANGSIDFDGTTVAACASGAITLTSTSTSASGIYLRANGGTSETVKIHSDLGTSVTEGAESVTILSDVGGVGIRSTANLANAINLTVDGGTTSSMTLFNDQGTSVTEGAESISLLSDAGGVGIRSTANLANAVNITADGGSTSTIQVFNDQGTSVTEGAASIAIVSDAGGVELRSTANLVNAINITNDGGTTGTISIFNDLGSSVTEGAESISLLSDAGGVGIRSTANLANAVNITADGGTTSTIQIFNDQGTAVNEGVASIQVLSDVGGIGIKSGLNAAGAIRLTADAGTSETIVLHADQGNGVGSICLTSDVGGITLNPATFVTVGGNATNAGEVRILEDTDNGSNYVALKAPNVATSYTITLPTAVAGTCGFVLTSTTAGVTSWAAASGGLGAAKAFGTVIADGTLQANSYNISGVVPDSTGNYTWSFDDVMGNVNFSAVGNVEGSQYDWRLDTPLVGSVQMHTRAQAGSAADAAHNITVHGDQ